MNIQLMPPPAFEKSLVPAFQTNFNRIRDAFLRTSNRVALQAYQSSGLPTWNVPHPFKANVLAVMSFSGYAGAAGLTGYNVTVDGVSIIPTALFWFNLINTHMAWNVSYVLPDMSAGTHTWKYETGAGIACDVNDKMSLALTFLEVS